MARKPVIIKKYENRRLYDTTNSRYVNQAQVARLIREGHDVQVLDAASGEDVTRLVLTQIIVEEAKEPDSTFPLDILRQMVVTSGKATQENALKYMKGVMEIYQNAYRALAPPLGSLPFLQPLSSPAGASSGSRRARKAAGARNADAGNAQELQQRVEELEALVAKLAAGKTRAKRKSKPRRAS
ncbi:MAG TPA: polyhydroxyalkanoate synthesis regulator DNA-binding domain-containing protein [Candidatus Binatia bacterium]|nr:polyhydroxyalkanoate synthesis regulator DNA-binding domain-containing protein [Candidatus Binatia bacterium]